MNTSTVFVVDDDDAVRDSLAMLLETVGFATEVYGSAAAFLAAWRGDRPGCLILDVRMPGMSGTELQAELLQRGIRLPIIFLTAHGDIRTTVQAMKAGAADFLTKPVNDELLIEQVRAALERDRERQEQDAAKQALRARLAPLSNRELEILSLAVAGHTNKEIARQLRISHRTVEVHRSRILLKTGAQTFLELASLAVACGLPIHPTALRRHSRSGVPDSD